MRGRRISLTPPRRFLADLLWVCRDVPTVPVQRRMNLAAVAAARGRGVPRIGWAAVFLKAYARTAQALPVLRRAWVGLPRPHLRQYPSSVASVAVERVYAGEPCVFFGRVGGNPARITLDALDALVKRWATAPLDDVPAFRSLLTVGRLPGWVRRPLLRLGLNLPDTRAGRFGTFGLSVYSGLGAESLHPLGPLTTTLTYGPIGPDGSADVRLVYDHRVTDGAVIARALARLEAELTGPVREELEAYAADGRAGCLTLAAAEELDVGSQYTQKDSNLQPSVP